MCWGALRSGAVLIVSFRLHKYRTASIPCRVSQLR